MSRASVRLTLKALTLCAFAVILGPAGRAAAQISGATSNASGATCSGGGSGDGDCRNSTQSLINNGTTFESRYAWNINADTTVFSTHDTSNGVAQSHSLTFTWNGSVRSNSCEAAVRQGESSGTTSGCDVCGYPGSPSRTQASDGHFVTVTLHRCGDGVVDTSLSETCDQ